jgi:hypothetical protein
MKQNLKYQRGQAIILIVIGLVGLIGLTALAVDGGNAYSDRRQAQGAADSAAFAAALNKLNNGTATTLVQAGQAQAATNGYNNDNITNTVDVHDPPISGPYTGNSEYIQVIITSHVKTFFAPVVGISQVTNTVQAVAHAKPAIPNLPYYGGNSIVGLAPSGCDAVELCGSSQLQIWGSGVYSNSSDSCGLEFKGGKQNQVTLYSGPFAMAAPGYTVSGNPQITSSGGFKVNQTQYPYPPSPDSLPNPTCSTNGALGANGTLSPGNFGTASNPQAFPPSGATTLSAGTYCVYGDFNVNANQTLTGTGVTVVMETGAIHWNGSSQVTLSGPTSGDLQGLTIYAPLSNTSVMVINGNTNVNLTGTVLMPGAALSYNGDAQIQKHNLQFIAKTVQLCGNLDTQLQYGSTDTAKQNSKPAIELAQ